MILPDSDEGFRVYALHYSGSYVIGYAIVVARSTSEAILELETAGTQPPFSLEYYKEWPDCNDLEFEKAVVLPLRPMKNKVEIIDWVWYAE